MITITGPEFNDDDLRTLMNQVEELPLLGLDLSGTSISDNAMQHLVDRGVFVLIAQGTQLTPAAVATLANTSICCLDIRDTAIQLEDLSAWRQFYALQALFISDQNVTPEDVRQLDRLPRLDYVLVNDEQTTKQLLIELNAGIKASDSMTEMEKIRYVESFSMKVAAPIRFYQDEM